MELNFCSSFINKNVTEWHIHCSYAGSLVHWKWVRKRDRQLLTLSLSHMHTHTHSSIFMVDGCGCLMPWPLTPEKKSCTHFILKCMCECMSGVCKNVWVWVCVWVGVCMCGFCNVCGCCMLIMVLFYSQCVVTRVRVRTSAKFAVKFKLILMSHSL